jgi:hypothetical protein
MWLIMRYTPVIACNRVLEIYGNPDIAVSETSTTSWRLSHTIIHHSGEEKSAFVRLFGFV